MRIITRPDFDGVVCAALLYEVENINAPVKWAEPGEIQKGQIEIDSGDIVANLPFHPDCALWFDHHYSNRILGSIKGAFKIAPSAAGVIHEYYRPQFKRDFTELVHATDKIDSADLTLDEVLHPERYDYIILSMTLAVHDPREQAYWNRLVSLLRSANIRKVIADPEVHRRIKQSISQNRSYRDYLKHYTRMRDHVAITDFRPLQSAPRGNRFLVYSMFPDAVVNVKIQYADTARSKVIVKAGHSIFNPQCRVNVGHLLSRYEGGGHHGAGSCRLSTTAADSQIEGIIDVLIRNQPLENPASDSTPYRG